MKRVVRLIKHAPFALTAGAAIGVLSYLWFTPAWLRYEKLPFAPLLQQVRPGEVVPLLVRRCNDSDDTRAYFITHELRSAAGGRPYLMPSGFVEIRPGCHEARSDFNTIPKDAPAGVYTVHGLAIIEGPLRSRTVPWNSQPFEVVNP